MTDILDLQTLRIFRFVRNYIREHGIPPSQREISAAVYMSTTSMVVYLTRLEMNGWLYRDYNIPRSIRIGDLAPTDEAFDDLWKAALEAEEESS